MKHWTPPHLQEQQRMDEENRDDVVIFRDASSHRSVRNTLGECVLQEGAFAKSKLPLIRDEIRQRFGEAHTSLVRYAIHIAGG